jgi:hypothetical protein
MGNKLFSRMYYNSLLRYYHELNIVSLSYGSLIKSPSGTIFVDCFGSKHKATKRELNKGRKKYQLFANLMAIALILGLFASLALKLTFFTGGYGYLLDYTSGIYMMIFCGITMLDLVWFLY